MKSMFRYVGIFCLLMTIPAIISSVMWVLTIGGFDYLEWMRSDMFKGINGFYSFFALIVAGFIMDGELK